MDFTFIGCRPVVSWKGNDRHFLKMLFLLVVDLPSVGRVMIGISWKYSLTFGHGLSGSQKHVNQDEVQILLMHHTF